MMHLFCHGGRNIQQKSEMMILKKKNILSSLLCKLSSFVTTPFVKSEQHTSTLPGVPLLRLSVSLNLVLTFDLFRFRFIFFLHIAFFLILGFQNSFLLLHEIDCTYRSTDLIDDIYPSTFVKPFIMV